MDVDFEFTHFMQAKTIVSHWLPWGQGWGQGWQSSSPLEMVGIALLFVGIEVLNKSDRLVV